MSVKIINNKSKSLISMLRELGSYKDLLWMLAYRDIRIKYAQTVLGIIWSVLTPVITVAILFMVFVQFAGLKHPDIPNVVFILSGMVLWSYFANMINHCAHIFLQSHDMIKKIYFPRILLTMSKAVSSAVELIMMVFLLLIACIYFGIWPSLTWLLAPVFILSTILFAFVVGTYLSALTIRYRDIHHMVPFIVQLGLFVTPVAYPVSEIPAHLKFVYFLNPIAIFIEGFRWSLFGSEFNGVHFLIAISLTILLGFLALIHFQKTMKFVADYV